MRSSLSDRCRVDWNQRLVRVMQEKKLVKLILAMRIGAFFTTCQALHPGSMVVHRANRIRESNYLFVAEDRRKKERLLVSHPFTWAVDFLELALDGTHHHQDQRCQQNDSATHDADIPEEDNSADVKRTSTFIQPITGRAISVSVIVAIIRWQSDVQQSAVLSVASDGLCRVITPRVPLITADPLDKSETDVGRGTPLCAHRHQIKSLEHNIPTESLARCSRWCGTAVHELDRLRRDVSAEVTPAPSRLDRTRVEPRLDLPHRRRLLLASTAVCRECRCSLEPLHFHVTCFFSQFSTVTSKVGDSISGKAYTQNWILCYERI